MQLERLIQPLRGFRWPLFALLCLIPALSSCGESPGSHSPEAWIATGSLFVLVILAYILHGLYHKHYPRHVIVPLILGAASLLIAQALAYTGTGSLLVHMIVLAGFIGAYMLALFIRHGKRRFAEAAALNQQYYFAVIAGVLLGEWLARVTLLSLIEQLMIGLILGSVYALIALGYTLVYGVIKLINFAHGDIYMLGAFTGYYLLRITIRLLHYNHGVSILLCWIISVVVSAALCALIAVIMERLAYRPLRGATRIAALITAVGVSFLLENSGIIVFGPNPKSYEPKTFEVYQVELADNTAFSNPRMFEVRDTQSKTLAASLFTSTTYARLRLVNPSGGSPWTEPLTIEPGSDNGNIELLKAEAEGMSPAPPLLFSFRRDHKNKELQLNWSTGNPGDIRLDPAFSGVDGSPLVINIPFKTLDTGPANLRVPVFNIVIVAVTLLLLWGLNILINKSMFGISMRALSFDNDAAKLMGVNIDRVIAQTFAIGGACAAVAGNMVGIYNQSIEPLMGILPGLKAFVAAVVGGIGSIPGAAAGGMIMGISESMVKGYIPSDYSDLADAFAFAILILVLLFKPSGLFGSTVREKV